MLMDALPADPDINEVTPARRAIAALSRIVLRAGGEGFAGGVVYAGADAAV
jgi:hypothetical protein